MEVSDTAATCCRASGRQSYFQMELPARRRKHAEKSLRIQAGSAAPSSSLILPSSSFPILQDIGRKRAMNVNRSKLGACAPLVGGILFFAVLATAAPFQLVSKLNPAQASPSGGNGD